VKNFLTLTTHLIYGADMTKKDNPGKYVPRSFCDERTHRIEQKIDSMKTEVINAINGKVHPPMTWQAKATIIASFVGSATAVIIALIA